MLKLTLRNSLGQINALVDKVIHPILETLHRPLYHTNPEFHASFAWRLLDSPSEASKTVPQTTKEEQHDLRAVPANSPFGDTFVQTLNEAFEAGLLSSQPTGGWDVSSIELKVSKEITTLRLGR